MYACYTRLPAAVKRDEQSSNNGARYSFDLNSPSRSTSGLLRPALDLSNSVTSAAFAWHMYDSPNSVFFQRRAVVDPLNSGVSTLFHPVRDFWSASSVPFYYHLPITLRALNPAARKLLREVHGSKKQFFDRYLRIRVYAIARKPSWLCKFRDYPFYRRVEQPNQPCEYRAKRLLSFSAQSFLDKFPGVNSSSSPSSSANESLVIHLFRNCSINYSHISDQLLYVKLQVPVLAIDEEDDGKHSLTEVEEMNELIVREKWDKSQCSYLADENARANSLTESSRAPWFDRSDAPLRLENYLNQHMLPFPTRKELHNAAINGGAKNLIVSRQGIPLNLSSIPVYRRMDKFAKAVKVGKQNRGCKSVREENPSIFVSNFEHLYGSMKTSPIVETYRTNEQTGDNFGIRNFASLVAVGVNDNVEEEIINDSVCRAFGSNTAYDFFTRPNTRSQLLYEISLIGADGGNGVGTRDLVFAVSLESLSS